MFKALDSESLQFFAVKEAVLEEADAKQIEQLSSELDILKMLRHPHIVSYLGHQYTETHLYVFLEYAAGGSLASVLSEFGPLAGSTLKRSTCGILEGLHFLHTRSPPVLHRDIKGANVLVDLSFTLKLADFGCSKRCLDTTKTFTTIGSVPWMAPEVISQKDGYGRKADIWSLGCTVIEMATAEKPWGNGAFDNMMYALNHISSSRETPPIPRDVSGCCQDFIYWCTRRSQDVRPGTEELLEHSFACSSGFELSGPPMSRMRSW